MKYISGFAFASVGSLRSATDLSSGSQRGG